jgi:hypothetical protein
MASGIMARETARPAARLGRIVFWLLLLVLVLVLDLGFPKGLREDALVIMDSILEGGGGILLDDDDDDLMEERTFSFDDEWNLP